MKAIHQIKTILIIICLCGTMYQLAPYEDTTVKANATDTEFTIELDETDLNNVSSFTASIKVTPQDGQLIDAAQADVFFSQNSLQVTQVTRGNLFGSDDQFWFPPTIDNSDGQLLDGAWSAASIDTNTPGYLYNISFDIVSTGDVSIQLANVDVDYNAWHNLTSIITNEIREDIVKMQITNEYPANNSNITARSPILSVDINHYDDNPMDLLWFSNVSGIWKMIGWNISCFDGTKRMSSYGIVASPFNQTISYKMNGLLEIDKRFYSNYCEGRELGSINNVKIYVPNMNDDVKPIFHGSLNGSNYTLSSSNEYTADITYDQRAPVNWTWEDIKNLDIITGTLKQDAYVNVSYDMMYGEGIDYYWKASLSDGLSYENESYYFKIIHQSPIISDILPLDGSTPIKYDPVLSAYVEEPTGGMLNVSFYGLFNETWIQIGENQTGYNGTFTQDTDGIFYNYSKDQIWKIVASNDSHSTEAISHFITREEQAPPINFTAKTPDAYSINLTWELPEHVDKVKIRRSTTGFPGEGNGSHVYENDGDHFTDSSGVMPGQTYYYSAWSYNNSDQSWSQQKNRTANITKPLQPTDLQVTAIDYNIINVSWDKGSGAEYTYIMRKIGTYPTDQNDGTLVYNGTSNQFSDTENVGGNISYYYRAWSLCDEHIVYTGELNEFNYTRNETIEQWSNISQNDMDTTPVGPPSPVTNDVDNITETTATLHAYLLSDGGEDALCGFYWGNDSTPHNVTVGTYNTSSYYDQNITAMDKAHEYYVQAWASNNYGFITGENTTFWTRPYAPINLNVTPIDGTTFLNLTWELPSEDNGIDSVQIQVDEDTYPTTPQNGTTIYFGTDNQYTLEGLNASIPSRHEYHTAYHEETSHYCIGGNPWSVVDDIQIYDDNWATQTFTVGYNGNNEYFYLTSIKLHAYKTGNPGPVYVSIRNATTIDGRPYTYKWLDTYQELLAPADQYDLATEAIDGNLFSSEIQPEEYYEIEFDEPLLLKKDHSYAIVVRAPFATSSNSLYWVKDPIKSTYHGGDCFTSTDGGTTWNEEYYSYDTYWGYYYGRADMNFELYGQTVFGLEGNKTYYFTAWGYNSSESIYSSDYDAESNTTNSNEIIVDAIQETGIEENNVTVRAHVALAGNNTGTVGVKYGTSSGTYTGNVTASSTYGEGDNVSIAVSSLSSGTTYYYRVWSKNGGAYYEDYESIFITKPSPPLAFTAQTWGARQINISWTKNNGQDQTIVTRKQGSLPSNMTDGIIRYYGNGSSFHDTHDATETEPNNYTFDLEESTTYYYRAWSYNNTIALNGTSTNNASNTTETNPSVSSLSPADIETNVDTPVNLSAIPTASSDATLSFWDVYNFNLSSAIIADRGNSTSWNEAWEINNTGTGYETKRNDRCDGSSRSWDRKFAYKRMSTGGTNLNTGKITAHFDHPRLISGIYISYGQYTNQPNYYSQVFYMGTKQWHMEYHDYYADQWITATDYAPSGDNTIGTNDLTVVDKVRVWMTSYYDGELDFRCDVRLNYVQTVEPELIGTTTVSSGSRGHVIWNDANIRDTLYYYGVTVDDGKTVIGSDIKYFYTEDIVIENADPANESTVGVTPEDHSISFDIEHTRGQTFDVDVDYSTFGPPYVWFDEQEWTDQTNDTFTWTYEDTGDYGTTYYWRVNTTDGVIYNTQIFHFTTRADYTPDSPSASIEVDNATKINFTNIDIDSKTDSFIIRYNISDYPNGPDEGYEAVNQTNANDFYHTGLEANTQYYYSLYAWNATDNLYSSRQTYTATTEGPDIPTINASAFNMTAINLTQITGNEYATSFLIYGNTTNFTTNRMNTSDFVANVTGPTYNHTGLLPDTKWYYTVWAWDDTHGAYSEPGFANTTTLGPNVTFVPDTYNTTVINLTQIIGNEYTDKIMIRYQNDSYPNTTADGTLVYEENFTGSALSHMHTSLTAYEDYYYVGWGWNNTFATWGLPFNITGKTNGPINLTNPYPVNGSQNVERKPTLAITATDFNSDENISIWFRGYNKATNQWEDIGSCIDVASGRYTAAANIFDAPLTWYTWSVNATDDTYWTNETYTFKTTDIDPPYNISINHTLGYPSNVTHTWDNNPIAERTIIMRKQDGYPTWPDDGVEIYNGTSNTTTDSPPNPGQPYYYRYYSYIGTNVGGSNTNAILTPPEKPDSVTVETQNHRRIDLSWVKGTGADYTYILVQKDFHSENLTDGTLVYNASGTSASATGLECGDYLNYFTVNPFNETIGTAAFEDGDPTPGTFNESADRNTTTEWDLQQVSSGDAIYIFNTTRDPLDFPGSTQQYNSTVRLFAGKILFKDFYHVEGASWNSSFTDVEGYNGTNISIWTGEKWNSDTEKEWWSINRTYTPPIYTQAEKEQIEVPNATKLKYTLWTDYVTPDIYEVQAGKLGYEYHFSLWSVALKDNMTQYSVIPLYGMNRTDDAPNNYVPEIESPVPANGTDECDPYYIEFKVNVSDKEGDLMDLYFQTNRTGEWETFATKGGVGNGTQTIATSTFSLFNHTYWWRVRAKDDADVTGSVYQTNWNTSDVWNFTVRDAYYPEAPSDFIANTTGLRTIKLTWTKGTTNTDRTYIVMKKNSAPTNETDGQMIYNGEGTEYSRTNLDPDTLYYFAAWSTNETDNVYSKTNVTTFNYTGSNYKANLTNPDPANGAIGINRFLTEVSVNVSDIDNDELYWEINGTYIQNTSGYTYNGTISAQTNTPLPDTDLVYWEVHVFDSYNWTNVTYHFTTTDNAAPYGYNLTPENNEQDVLKNTAQITFNLADPNGNPINWTVEGEYVTNTGQNQVSNGSYSANLITPLPYDEEIIWYLNTTDGADSLNRSYSFTVEHNYAPTITNEYPYDAGGGVSVNQNNVSVTIEDQNGDEFDWTIHGNFLYINTNSGTDDTNGTYVATTNTPLPSNDTIVWYVNVTDGFAWSNRTLYFNTSDNTEPDQPTNATIESITGFGENYCSVYDVFMNVTISDPDGDDLDVSYYLDGRKIGEVHDVMSGSMASLNTSTCTNISDWFNTSSGQWEPRNILNHSMTYTWYVAVSDGVSSTTSESWQFNTSEGSDLYEDGDMTLNDITQRLIVEWYYTPEPFSPGGKIDTDIDNNGYVALDDLMAFTSHWYDDRYYP